MFLTFFKRCQNCLEFLNKIARNSRKFFQNVKMVFNCSQVSKNLEKFSGKKHVILHVSSNYAKFVLIF